MPLFLCWGDTWSDVWSDILGGAKTKRVIWGDIWSDKISLFFYTINVHKESFECLFLLFFVLLDMGSVFFEIFIHSPLF